MDDLDRARYISLTTFKKDGSSVSSPVWITGAGGAYAFTTGGKAWKTLRLSRNPSVQVQVCDMRGRVDPQARIYVGVLAAAVGSVVLSANVGLSAFGSKPVDSVRPLVSIKVGSIVCTPIGCAGL